MSGHSCRAMGRLFIRHAFLLLLLAVLPLCAAAASTSAVQGEEIPLRGTATGSTVVYLFLTGPNLPPEGIRLDGGTPVTTGVSSSFTRVDVNTDGTWTYTWRTGSVGRVLSPGNYLIFISEGPRARPDLGDIAYATWPVIFGAPAEPVSIVRSETTAPVPAGTMQGDPLVTGPGTPAEPAPAAGTPLPTTAVRPGLSLVIPLGAAALALTGSWRRR